MLTKSYTAFYLVLFVIPFILRVLDLLLFDVIIANKDSYYNQNIY